MDGPFPPSFSARVAALIVAVVTVTGEARGEGPTVRVHGRAVLDARTRRAGERVRFIAAVRDDAGVAVRDGALRLRLARVGVPEDPTLAAALRAATVCDGIGGALSVAGGELHLTPNDAGEACAELRLPLDRYRTWWSFSGGRWVDGAEVESLVDVARSALELRFVSPPSAIDLDGGPVPLEVAAVLEDDTTPAGLALRLTDERGAPLGDARTDAAGRAHFTVVPSALAGPGRGALAVIHVATSDVASARGELALARTAQVHLSWRAQAPSARAGDPLALDVRAVTKGGPAPGSVVATLGDTSEGSAPLENGEATVALLVGEALRGRERAVVRYAPASPFYREGNALEGEVTILPPSPWPRVGAALASLAVLAWLASTRRGASLRRRSAPSAPIAAASRRRGPGVRTVEAGAKGGERGWRGIVRDAQSERPIDGARVAIEVAGFADRRVLAEQLTDSAGRFELPVVDRGVAVELVAESRVHSELRAPLPPPGVLEMSLVERRHAPLARLVAWAQRAGAPYVRPPETTAGHVGRVAEDPAIAAWAAAVERAAFGPEPLDRSAEAAVDALAPEPPQPATPKR